MWTNLLKIQHKTEVNLVLLTSKAVSQTLLKLFCNCLLCTAGLKAKSVGCLHYLLSKDIPGAWFYMDLQDTLDFIAHASLQPHHAVPGCFHYPSSARWAQDWRRAEQAAEISANKEPSLSAERTGGCYEQPGFQFPKGVEGCWNNPRFQPIFRLD